jgi:hypothetical protein
VSPRSAGSESVREIIAFLIERHGSYNSRHLAQEDHLKETKTAAELDKAKSTIRQANPFSFCSFGAHALTRPAVSRIGVMCVILNVQMFGLESEY